MAYPSNRPDASRLKRALTGSKLTLDEGGKIDDETLQEVLDASTAWVEDLITGSFDAVTMVADLYDGNGTNMLTLRKRPVTSVQLVTVELPVLALTRTYTPQEIKLYVKEGNLEVFTYKLAAESASLHLDQQVYGNIFPPLPQVVRINYTYGLPQYDPDTDTTLLGPAVNLPQLTLPNGQVQTPFAQDAIVAPGKPDPELVNWTKSLQWAAVLDAAASVLGQMGGLSVGVVQAVSFDGFSQTANPQAFGPQVQAMVARRDEILGRRRRSFHMSTVG